MVARDEWVVVVGASGAFGTAIVDRLVGRGLQVAAVGRHLESIGALVERHGEAVRPCATDIAADAATDTIRAALDDDRPVRAVVHGPGVAVAGGIATVPTSALVDAVDIKVGGLLRLVRAVDDRLVEGSRIIAIAGHYGLEPSPYAAAAGIANAALINVVRQLSLAYGARGVTAHTIAPGPADTERLHRVAADRAAMQGTTVADVLDQMRADSSLRQLTTPAQVAWAVSTLLDPEASATTGSTLMLDAGRRRGLP
ncbi:MAG: SDR family oxidoreductase [Ilumatobacteraceae bacterium]|nr:SDR family oxidoreductase [Acidimicrobiales bacterium]MCB9396152.1 SDR family oxidoreductase [Acidimicrobiaceae bacterium]